MQRVWTSTPYSTLYARLHTLCSTPVQPQLRINRQSTTLACSLCSLQLGIPVSKRILMRHDGSKARPDLLKDSRLPPRPPPLNRCTIPVWQSVLEPRTDGSSKKLDLAPGSARERERIARLRGIVICEGEAGPK